MALDSRFTRLIRPTFLVAIMTFGLLGFEPPAFGQPTSFTYQGQLKDGGSPASGAFDMSFSIFDAEVDGNLIAGPLVFDGQGGNPPQMNVSSGLFTTTLNFGAGIFDGNPRWLEITVAGTPLSPRQAITSAPYAQRANDAQSCNTANVANYAYAPWVPSGADLYYSDGNVGIGMSAPTAKLEIGGTPGIDGIKFPDGSLQTSAIVGGGGPWQSNGSDVWYGGGGVGVIGGSSPFPSGKGVFLEGGNASRGNIFAFDYDTFLPLSLVLNAPGGNVGIGTVSPTGKLHVAASSGATIYGTTSGGLAISGLATSNFGGTGVYGEHQNGFNSGSLGALSTGVRGVAQIAGNVGGSFANTDSGGVALEVTQGATRVKKLEAEGIGNGAEILRFTTERPWIFRQTLTGPSTGLELYSTSGIKTFQITALGGTPVATFVADDAAPRLTVNGTTVTKVLQITGADLAEKFPTSGGKVEPGMVMEIDPENSGLLRMARGAYNQRVAGVVSGANDFPAGAILGHLPGYEEAPPIALSGRVWTCCDATEHAIGLGDLLTTSATPGHAMRASDRERSHGAIIGKAMTTLKSGKGLVLVLVNLQ